MSEKIIGQLALQLDEVLPSTTYVGDAFPGSLTSSSVWRIKRIVETGPDSEITWADGNGNFDNIWDNRVSLTYL